MRWLQCGSDASCFGLLRLAALHLFLFLPASLPCDAVVLQLFMFSFNKGVSRCMVTVDADASGVQGLANGAALAAWRAGEVRGCLRHLLAIGPCGSHLEIDGTDYELLSRHSSALLAALRIACTRSIQIMFQPLSKHAAVSLLSLSRSSPSGGATPL